MDFFVSSYNPWFIRGNAYNNGSDAGVFAFNNANGHTNGNGSFRVVYTIFNIKVKKTGFLKIEIKPL